MSDEVLTGEVLDAGDERLVEVIRDATVLVAAAARFSVIAMKDDADEAGLYLRGVRTKIREIESIFKKLRDPINDAIKRNRELEAKVLAPLQAESTRVAKGLEDWLREERRRVDEENKRRLEEAEARARADQKDAADAIRRAAESAPTVKERQGLERQARAVERSQPMPVMTRTVEAPKIAGIATPTRKVADVVNLKQLLRGIIDGVVPEAAIKVDQSWLNGEATRRGKDLNFPGVVVREDSSLSARGL
jgi:hypothetical protein